MRGLMTHAGAGRVGRQDLLAIPTPEATETHTTIAHSAVVEAALEALAYRNVSVVREEYAVSQDGMRMFGVMTLDIERSGISLALGLRNSNDKSFSLGMVAGFRVFVCDNLAFHGDFFALARKHSKRLMETFTDSVSIGVDRVQRRFQPMAQQVDAWREHSLPDIRAKEIIYDAAVGGVDMPRHMMREVHRQYFEPEHDDFRPRTLWSLQNAFTGAFKRLDPIPMYRATASLGEYFSAIQ